MSGSTSRRKGQRYESEVRRWLQERGLKCLNPAEAGKEGADIHLVDLPWMSGEAKNQAKMTLSAWIDQARGQCDGDQFPYVIHKRKGKTDIGEHYVTMQMKDFADLMEIMWKLKEESNPFSR